MTAHLIGEFDCKLDAKGRLMVPSGLKKQLPLAETDGLVINRGFEKHLTIYTKAEWDKITAELASLNSFEKKTREFIRYFTRGASILTLDASGRVLLPKSLLEYAGIQAEVVLSCQFDKIEVWSKEAYDAQMDDEPENFANLAEEVMGNKGRSANGE
ncbi:division/cell wall cluster transcriptional repressor MraZ [Pelobium manganitolerans]|uniref:Transcriptional regulator MraZ n=1 Tax=Pelobium manganitolerans TaxID=1842495 RepID=A0A419S2L9_9SPHI|nr:division/cell wall cluster transcriptional repressor MraZ [Pelobium manganitolerans]RKD13231.1 division/cell wall cluster transcriptional repressor MraZ [Pelobium manganitolerans]